MNILFVNKYQPTLFSEFENSEDLIEILNTLLLMDNLNILFIGENGCGKTTVINALIREYYGENVNINSNQNNSNQNNSNQNILYINPLKEQGINYYRNDVKTFCQTWSSIKNKKKLVVMDDVDNINEQNQHVFRNYMDKYGNNVHFIASCSNSQKVTESLQSRFIIIKINALTKIQLNSILNKIMKIEQIQLTSDAIDFLLNISTNAKILINYMEKIKLLNCQKNEENEKNEETQKNQMVNLNTIMDICTNINFFLFEEYLKYIRDKELIQSIFILYNIYDKGYSVMDILDNFFIFIKITNMLSEDEKYQIIQIICKYIAYFHNIHEDEIELSLFSNELYKLLA